MLKKYLFSFAMLLFITMAAKAQSEIKQEAKALGSEIKKGGKKVGKDVATESKKVAKQTKKRRQRQAAGLLRVRLQN